MTAGRMIEKRGRCSCYVRELFVCTILTMFCGDPSTVALGFSSNSHCFSRNGNTVSFQLQLLHRDGLSLQQRSKNCRLHSSNSRETDENNEVDIRSVAIEEGRDEESEEEEARKMLLKEEGERRRQKMMEDLEKEKRTNIGVAAFSVMAAVLNYVYQLFHPVTELQLLVAMQDQSSPVTCIGHNGKPTVVDFWAPWCDNCKSFAPTLQSIEKEYSDRVNFVMVNGDEGANWPLINRFGVDAIPHMALISADGNIETALIGPVPKSVMSTDLDVLLENASAEKNTNVNAEHDSSQLSSPPKIELPYTMYDAFQNKPELRHISFDE